MKRIYQRNDTYKQQKAFVNRQWKKNKQALFTVFLEICFVFSPIHQSLQQTKKNTPAELCQYRMVLKCVFRQTCVIIYICCVDAGWSA